MFFYYSVASCPIANQAHVNEDCVTEERLPIAEKQVYSKLSISNIKLILKLYKIKVIDDSVILLDDESINGEMKVTNNTDPVTSDNASLNNIVIEILIKII